MIENPKTFNDLREVIKKHRDFRYWEFDEIEAAEKEIDDLINTIEQQFIDCCNCMQS